MSVNQQKTGQERLGHAHRGFRTNFSIVRLLNRSIEVQHVKFNYIKGNYIHLYKTNYKYKYVMFFMKYL